MATKRSTKQTSILAWHWVKTNSDGQPVMLDGTVVEAGKEYRLPAGEAPILCEYGYHASINATDSLEYAPGPIICRVEVSGTIKYDTDKLVASSRKVLWMADAIMVLHEFACRVAEDALLAERAAGREPDPRSWNAIAVKRRWMAGNATDDELAAARAATSAAAWEAAREATRAAASAAAWEAASAAAWEAASAATSAAAWAATREATRAAAWEAASAAAWEAAREKYSRWLEELLLALEPKPEEVS